MYRLEAALTHQIKSALMHSLQHAEEPESFHKKNRIQVRLKMYYKITKTANVHINNFKRNNQFITDLEGGKPLTKNGTTNI